MATANSLQSGATMRSDATDCNSVNGANGNVGCQNSFTSQKSFGKGFNDAKGGVFATEWSDDGIRLWFFSRSDSIPADITSGQPNPAGWGKPTSMFSLGASCDGNHFQKMQLILNNNFCGDWYVLIRLFYQK